MPSRIEDGRLIEVGLRHRCRADEYRFIGHAHMQRVGVGFAEHRHGAIAQGLSGALDPAGDFTAVGDEDLAEGGHVGHSWGFPVAVRASSRASFAPTGERVATPLWEQSRSRERTSELQSQTRLSYAVFCLKKKKYTI